MISHWRFYSDDKRLLPQLTQAILIQLTCLENDQVPMAQGLQLQHQPQQPTIIMQIAMQTPSSTAITSKGLKSLKIQQKINPKKELKSIGQNSLELWSCVLFHCGTSSCRSWGECAAKGCGQSTWLAAPSHPIFYDVINLMSSLLFTLLWYHKLTFLSGSDFNHLSLSDPSPSPAYMQWWDPSAARHSPRRNIDAKELVMRYVIPLNFSGSLNMFNSIIQTLASLTNHCTPSYSPFFSISLCLFSYSSIIFPPKKLYNSCLRHHRHRLCLFALREFCLWSHSPRSCPSAFWRYQAPLGL